MAIGMPLPVKRCDFTRGGPIMSRANSPCRSSPSACGSSRNRDGLAPPVVQAGDDPNVRPGSSPNSAVLFAGTGQPEQVQFDVRLTAAALLTRAVYQDGHWIAEYAPLDSTQWQRVPVSRVDYLVARCAAAAGGVEATVPIRAGMAWMVTRRCGDQLDACNRSFGSVSNTSAGQ